MCPPETEVLGRAAAAELSDDDKTQIDALLRADHDNPFGFLGLQWNEARGGFDLRVLQPGASRLTAIDSDGAPLFELKRVHPEGFFIGVSGRDRPFAYRLRREGPGGTVELDDPYRFPPLLGELDLHLLAEGRHWRNYEHLGAHLRELGGVTGVAFAVWAPNARRVQ